MYKTTIVETINGVTVKKSEKTCKYTGVFSFNELPKGYELIDVLVNGNVTAITLYNTFYKSMAVVHIVKE